MAAENKPADGFTLVRTKRPVNMWIQRVVDKKSITLAIVSVMKFGPEGAISRHELHPVRPCIESLTFSRWAVPGLR